MFTKPFNENTDIQMFTKPYNEDEDIQMFKMALQ